MSQTEGKIDLSQHNNAPPNVTRWKNLENMCKLS